MALQLIRHVFDDILILFWVICLIRQQWIISEKDNENRVSKAYINSLWTKGWDHQILTSFVKAWTSLSHPLLPTNFFIFLTVLIKSFACLNGAENNGVWGEMWFNLCFCLQWIVTSASLFSSLFLYSHFQFPKFSCAGKLLLVNTLIQITN